MPSASSDPRPDIASLQKLLDFGFWLIPAGHSERGMDKPVSKWKYEWSFENPKLVADRERLSAWLKKASFFLYKPDQLGCIGLDLDRGHEDGVDGVSNFENLVGKKLFSDWTPKVWVETPRGGVHLLFKNQTGKKYKTVSAIESPVTRKKTPGVDLRGTGGIIAAPGARKWHGQKLYILHGELSDLEPIPDFIEIHLPYQKEASQLIRKFHGSDCHAFLKYLRDSQSEHDLSDKPAGCNDQIFWFACRASEKGFSEESINEAVLSGFPVYVGNRSAGAIASSVRSAFNRSKEAMEIRRADFNKPLPPEAWVQEDCIFKEDADGNVVTIPRVTYPNFRAMLHWYGLEFRENIMTHDIECTHLSDGEGKVRNAVQGIVEAVAAQNNFRAFDRMQSWLNLLAHETKYHPVRDFINSVTWDGQSRLAALADTIQEGPDYSKTLKEKLLRTWLISAVAAVFEPNFSNRIVLILQGEESTGKTKWFARLFRDFPQPVFKQGLSVDPHEKDSLIRALSFWVCELGELEGNTRRVDQAAMKAFLTSDCDVLRAPYDKRQETYPRRTVFCASVNPSKALPNIGKNTRYALIPTDKVNHVHDVDMPQVWAEVKTLYDSGEQWWLDKVSEDFLVESNRNFQEIDPMEDRILRHFDFAREHDTFLDASGVFDVINHPTRNLADSRRLGDIFDKYRIKRLRNKESRGFLLPKPLTESEIHNTEKL